MSDATPPTIGLVTDSSSQITQTLVERFAVEVVPMTVTVDGEDHLEGVDLDADAFYSCFVDGARPIVATSQPSPGRFVDAYRRLVDRGCDEIISIHIAEAMSGTIGSATLAAQSIGVPVHVVDTASASFGVSVCVWTAGVAIAAGASAAEVRARIADVVPRIGTSFMIGVPMLTERGGRVAGIDLHSAGVGDRDGVPVLAMSGGQLEVLDRVSTVDDTIDVMSTYASGWGASGWGERITVAIGVADEPSRALAERLRGALAGLDRVDEIVEYRVGPSVGAHTGPGTFGLFVFPTPA